MLLEFLSTKACIDLIFQAFDGYPDSVAPLVIFQVLIEIYTIGFCCFCHAQTYRIGFSPSFADGKHPVFSTNYTWADRIFGWIIIHFNASVVEKGTKPILQ